MDYKRTDGFTYGVRVMWVNSCAPFMVESYEKRTRIRTNEVSFKLGVDSHVHYD